MRRSAAAVVASILVAATLAGCANADPAEPYAREGCEAWFGGETADTNGNQAASWRLLAEAVDDTVRPPLASAAKRDGVYSDAHSAAVEVSSALTTAASAVDGGGAPSPEVATRVLEAVDALQAACGVVLAD
jgi:hypothetical protein